MRVNPYEAPRVADPTPRRNRFYDFVGPLEMLVTLSFGLLILAAAMFRLSCELSWIEKDRRETPLSSGLLIALGLITFSGIRCGYLLVRGKQARFWANCLLFVLGFASFAGSGTIILAEFRTP